MIKFYIPNSESLKNIKRASRRFRAMIPLKGMRPNDKIIGSLDQVKPGDIVVVAKKVKQQEVLYLKNIDAKVVYDICDSKWHKPYAVEQLNDMSFSLTEIIGLFGYQSPVQVGNALNGGSGAIKSFSKAGSVAATGKVEIHQVDDDGNYVETWTLRNAWIKDIQFGSNDYSSDDAQEITIKLRYDWAEFEGPNGKATYAR